MGFIDVTEGDWQRFLSGMSWEHFVQPIVEAYAKLEAEKGVGNFDRNDVLRPDFNLRARGAEGKLFEYGVVNFYKDWRGLFARIRAYETGKEHCLTNAVVRAGEQLFTNPEYRYIADYLDGVRLSEGRRPTVLDHGAGLCWSSMYLASLGFDVVMHDWPIPSFNLMAYLGSLNFHGHFNSTSPRGTRDIGGAAAYEYDAIITMDVLEHVINPIDQLGQLAAQLRKGGRLLMGTFFDSCQGKDPQHLEEHKRYQDTSVWFGEVEALGLRLCFKDANGVEKVWEKI